MTKSADQLPADPAQLHLAYAFGHGLRDGAHERSVERWEIVVRHGFEVHDDARCPTLTGPEGADDCVGECPAFFEDGVQVGSMVFYRIRMWQGRNSFWAMEEESQELYEIAEVLIDSGTGHFVDELDEELCGFGSDLLVMDQVGTSPGAGSGLVRS